jgi:hypothetical protein
MKNIGLEARSSKNHTDCRERKDLQRLVLGGRQVVQWEGWDWWRHGMWNLEPAESW